ncbi:MAG: FKBP-type peptidyl-prolyl cis-trans isomerase [Candidatus Babeliaceae bacterium]|nr:FKBP-type peptidyl-prolyl cis-trans isomerase [Candidatus Babeliaceae bacterium]
MKVQSLLLGCFCLMGTFYTLKGTIVNEQKTTDLTYEVITAAPVDAQQPRVGQNVTVHYAGWLEENGKRGRKFDSSIDRGQPFTFRIGVGHVIQGWDLGVLSMRVGEKRLLRIPPHLGYGSRGAGAAIPPNATLLFEVELLAVQS